MADTKVHAYRAKVTTEGRVKMEGGGTSEVSYKRFREHIREKSSWAEIYHLWQFNFIYDFIYIHITRVGQRLLQRDSSMPLTIINYNLTVWQQGLAEGPVDIFRIKASED